MMNGRHAQTGGHPDEHHEGPRSARGVEESALATDLVHVIHSWVSDIRPEADGAERSSDTIDS